MEIELLKKHKFWKKGKQLIVTNDYGKELIKKKIAKDLKGNIVAKKEAKFIASQEEE